ncbi:MAG TPA: UDP-N-acetylmuramoyl-L-alanine--D-glutamate ligase [Polyangiaceae bacterium]|nr:UDP-N-acetylmuramoyl-L-alanine--D-glutamate ligase [Polyangiaceae bacterium]
MDLAQKTVVIVGLGDSGVAASLLALAKGAARVRGTDSSPEDKLSPAARSLSSKGVQIVTGRQDAAVFEGASLVVVSPGVPPMGVLDQVRARGAEVIGELEFASRFVSAPVVAIGGTNGKSTTTALVHHMLASAGKKAFVGANFGVPLSTAAAGATSFEALVLEVSSFQMERAPTFHPQVAAFLNVTEDHLDRYPSFDAYVAAKGNMFVNQTPDDVAVVPKGDTRALREAHRGEGRTVTFGPGGDVGPDQEGTAIVDRLREHRYPIDAIRLRGAHNMLNVAAAIACASEAGAKPEAIALALSKFEGLAHRTAFVSEIAGVRYYDDSKGTNVGASVSALRGLSEPRVVLIAGGRDKQGTYGPLVRELAKKGRALVLIGEASARIAEAAGGAVTTVRASTMDEAVTLAKSLARAGDAVLLSPACSSFDMFKDYKDRGDAFVRAVRAAKETG